MKIIKIAQEITLEMVKDPNCPPAILAEVLRTGKDDIICGYSALNPNCPPKALAEVLMRGKADDVSCHAANNLNCPPEYKWLWENTVMDTFGFLDYIDAPPEIKNNPEITQMVKKELLKIISDKVKFNLVLDTEKERKQTLDLIREFSNEDFIISLYKRKFKI
jgi:hypothetical protein